MQLRTDRSAADLKQCMLVRNSVRLEKAPTARHCDVWHQCTAIAIGEQSAESVGTVSPEQLVMTQLFHDWPNSPHDNAYVCFGFIPTPSGPLMLTNLFL